MPHPDWNERYTTGETPWDTGEPDEHLVGFLRSGAAGAGRALEIGCGTGTNVLWLARQGVAVLGIDVAAAALEEARTKKAADGGLDCRFERLDFLRDEVPGGPFDLVFDRGCFHVFDAPGDRDRFAQRVASLLGPKGRWLSLIGSTEGPERDSGPPRRSARDVMNAIEPALEILEFRAIHFHADLAEPPAAWFCLSRRREVPAVPSTRRD